MKNIAIIGGGVAGLTLAYKLLQNKYNVTIFEQNKDVGGQLYAFPIEGVNTEIYYHHTFMSDTNFIDLCKELQIYDKLQWLDSSMAYYTNQKQFAFGTPFDLLKFSPLRFFDKIKFVISILRLQNMKNIQEVENYSAKEWFIQHGFENVWTIIWEPLFKLKFADLSDEISLVWLWDKLIKRGKSRGGAKEKLCYMEGSFFNLIVALKKQITLLNGSIRLETKIKSIKQNSKGFDIIHTMDDKLEKFDVVISTLSSKNHKLLFDFSEEYTTYLDQYKYQSAICALLVLDKKFSDFYWTNIGDYSIPFGGIIEHTNFVGCERYKGKSIVYLSKYLSKDSKFYSKQNEDILQEFYGGLKEINNEFSEKNVTESYVFKQDDAQPIVPKGYMAPSIKTEVKNLYWISTHHVYPHDRGIEYAIEIAKKIVMEIKND